MRIVVVSAWDPTRISDGSCLVLHHHLRVLAQRHDLTVLVAEHVAGDGGGGTLPESVQLASFPPSGSRALDHARRRLAARRSGEPAHVHYVARPELLAALDHEMAAGADLLHLFGWGTAALWPHAAGRPTLHVAVDPWARNAANRRLPGWRRLLDETHGRIAAHERRHYPHVGAVVVVAPHDAAWLAERVPDARIEVVANGVEAGPTPPAAPAAPVIGFHGAFEAAANVDAAHALVDEVLPRVRARVPDARAILIGRDPPASVRALAGPFVEVTGTVDAVRPWLEQLAVYVAPIRTGTGLRNKVLEAMAAGRPVVATPLALAGIGTDDGVIEAADVAGLADATVRLLTEPGTAAALGAAARVRVERDFTWEASAARIEALWEGLVSGAADGTGDAGGEAR